MRTGISITITRSVRGRLEAQGDWNSVGGTIRDLQGKADRPTRCREPSERTLRKVSQSMRECRLASRLRPAATIGNAISTPPNGGPRRM